ncbi:MAG: transcriptional repressor LexA [Treponema sp.]|jgi:repressor LexA|nr:transcriptional repressor LexA [Treponema sp.]
MKELTKRQKEVLSFIANHINKHSYPPTIREIAEHFSISVKGAYDHIAALKRKNCLRQDGNRSRTMVLTETKEDENSKMLLKIPIVGTVAAGVPILSEENWEGTLTLHRPSLKKNKVYFAVKVRGDSMQGAGIMDGDMAVIEKQSAALNGEIVVAVVDEAVTLKRFYRESSRIKLQAENPDYKPIYCQDVRILGRLAQIIRQY